MILFNSFQTAHKDVDLVRVLAVVNALKPISHMIPCWCDEMAGKDLYKCGGCGLRASLGRLESGGRDG